MTSTQVFDLSTIGEFPHEKYALIPITFDPNNLPQDFTSIFWSQLDGSGVAIPTGGSLITRNYLNYFKNPMCNILGYNDTEYNNILQYNNINYTKFSDKFTVSLVGNIETRYIEKVSTATIYNTNTNKSNITIDFDRLREKYNTPYEFYFLYLQLNDITKNSYGCVLYPSKIFLNPKQITNENGKWQLITSVDALTSKIVHIQSNQIEKDAFNIHKEHLNNLSIDLIKPIPSNLSAHHIYFGLYANRAYMNYPIVSVDNFSLAPASSSFNLSDIFGEIGIIDKDSTFASYSGVYVSVSNEILNITQSNKNGSYLYDIQTFNPTFLINYDPQINSKQTFKLIQNKVNPNAQLYDTSNCVFSVAIDLNSGALDYFNAGAPSNVSMDENFPLKINTVINGYNLLTTNVGASSTLTSQSLSVTGTSNYNRILTDIFHMYELSGSDVIWETEYPPYCYNYKIILGEYTGKHSPDIACDTYTLNFYLKLSSMHFNSSYALLSAFATTDFNKLKMPLLETDSISFKVVSTSIENDKDFINQLQCYYGGVPYDIITSPYVPVRGDALFEINYSNSPFNGIRFSVQGSVLTSSGNLDSFETVDIALENPISDVGNKMYLNVINERSNNIWVDASFNVTESEWPTRDLRGSKILWYYDDYFDVDLNYIDEYGKFLSPVTGEDVFNDYTMRVSLSGYGPNLASVLLSSQKYNEVVRVYTNPNLFDFLSEGKLIVGPYTELDNLNLTRTIKLTAAIPYGERIFRLPSNIPINWTWEYDDLTDPFIQPIKVKLPLKGNEDYTYATDIKSTLVSAIELNVTPGYAKDYQKLHNVKIIANVDVVQPPVTGSYSFKLDDFPDPSIFNCDFVTYFKEFSDDPVYQIANTRFKNKSTITRSWDSILNLTFSAHDDILSTVSEGKLFWGYNNTIIYETQDSKSLDIDFTDPNYGLPPQEIDNLQVSGLNINFTLQSSYAKGWTSAHNVSATVSLYVLDPGEFYAPMQFILYPKYAWLGQMDLSGRMDYSKVTILSTDETQQSYFTNAFAPTAYLNTKTDSFPFWLSANKIYFTEYIYQNLQNYEIVSSDFHHSVLDIPYDPNNFYTTAGIPISLIAYNESFYPTNIDSPYIDLLYSENPNVGTAVSILTSDETKSLITNVYQISAKTKTVKNYSTEDIYSNFSKSIKFRNYNDILLKFDTYCNGNKNLKAFNIELSSGVISISQSLETIPLRSPAIVTSGTVTYYLSSKYWEVSATVPINSLTSTYFDLFTIKYGDPSIPLYAGELGYSEFFIYAKPSLIQQIPSTTFSNYSSQVFGYPENPDLWKEILI